MICFVIHSSSDHLWFWVQNLDLIEGPAFVNRYMNIMDLKRYVTVTYMSQIVSSGQLCTN